MKRVVKWATRALGVLFLAYAYFAVLHPTQVVADHPFFSPPEPVVIAHQGGRGLWPENTLFAFERSLALGVDVLEMDLQITRDGETVVMHDDTVDRTTDGEGAVSSLSLDEVKRLDAGYRFEGPEENFPFRGHGLEVPTLTEVLRAFPDARVNLEMKRFDAEGAHALCRMLEAEGATERTLVASFDHAPMRAFRAACSTVATSATMREGLLFYQLGKLGLSSLFRSPAVAFQVPEYFGDLHVIDDALLERSRQSNVRIQVWTVNERADMERLLAMGVNGIITDRPDVLLDVVASRGESRGETASARGLRKVAPGER